MDNKLNGKDLINVGIFTVIYIILFFVSGMLGYIPIFAVALPLVVGILTGIPFILFITKTKKFGMVTLMGILVGILCFLMGQSWIAIVSGVVCGLLADLIFKSGGYKSWKKTLFGYCVFTEWVIGSMLPMWIMRDVFIEQAEKMPSADYKETIMALTTDWMLPVVIVLGIVGAIIGAYIGRSTLKKHFQRAGIV